MPAEPTASNTASPRLTFLLWTSYFPAESSSIWARLQWTLQDMTSPAFSLAPKERSVSLQRSLFVSSSEPRRLRFFFPLTTQLQPPAKLSRILSPRQFFRQRWRLWIGCRSRPRKPLSIRITPPARLSFSSNWMALLLRSVFTCNRFVRFAGRTAHGKIGSPKANTNDCWFGRAARPPLPQRDVSRPTISFRTALFRAPNYRSFWKGSSAWLPQQVSALRTSSMRATAIFTLSFSTMLRSPDRRS